MILKKQIKWGISVLSNPNEGFKITFKESFEVILGYYLMLLIGLSVATAAVTFVFTLIKAVYLDIFLTVEIQYLRMLNYTMGRSTSLIFLYFFVGTFALFFLSIVLKPFFRKIKYTHLLQIMFFSLVPMLFFSWIPVFTPALFIWSVFLFIRAATLYLQSYAKKSK